MKIFGIGTDIVNIKRLEKSLKKIIKILKIEFSQRRRFNTVKKKRSLRRIMLKDLLQKKL